MKVTNNLNKGNDEYIWFLKIHEIAQQNGYAIWRVFADFDAISQKI